MWMGPFMAYYCIKLEFCAIIHIHTNTLHQKNQPNGIIRLILKMYSISENPNTYCHNKK